MTKQVLDKNKMYEVEDKYLTEKGKPKRMQTQQLLKMLGKSEGKAPSAMSNQASVERISNAESALPPVKDNKNKNMTE